MRAISMSQYLNYEETGELPPDTRAVSANVERCSECHEPCHGVMEDDGFGSVDYMGAPYTDSRIRYASECCLGDVMLNGRVVECPEPDEDYYAA